MPSRSDLKAAIRSMPVWDEVSKEYSNQIKRASQGDAFAKCLQDAMDNGRAGKDAYKKCAKDNGISDKLSKVWS